MSIQDHNDDLALSIELCSLAVQQCGLAKRFAAMGAQDQAKDADAMALAMARASIRLSELHAKIDDWRLHALALGDEGKKLVAEARNETRKAMTECSILQESLEDMEAQNSALRDERNHYRKRISELLESIERQAGNIAKPIRIDGSRS